MKSEVRVFWTTLLPSFCSVHFPKRLVQPKRMSLPRYYESCRISVRDRSSLAFAPWHLSWVHLHRNDLGLCHYLCRLCSHWCCPGLLLSIALQAGSSSSIFQRQEKEKSTPRDIDWHMLSHDSGLYFFAPSSSWSCCCKACWTSKPHRIPWPKVGAGYISCTWAKLCYRSHAASTLNLSNSFVSVLWPHALGSTTRGMFFIFTALHSLYGALNLPSPGIVSITFFLHSGFLSFSDVKLVTS